MIPHWRRWRRIPRVIESATPCARSGAAADGRDPWRRAPSAPATSWAAEAAKAAAPRSPRTFPQPRSAVALYRRRSVIASVGGATARASPFSRISCMGQSLLVRPHFRRAPPSGARDDAPEYIPGEPAPPHVLPRCPTVRSHRLFGNLTTRQRPRRPDFPSPSTGRRRGQFFLPPRSELRTCRGLGSRCRHVFPTGATPGQHLVLNPSSPGHRVMSDRGAADRAGQPPVFVPYATSAWTVGSDSSHTPCRVRRRAHDETEAAIPAADEAATPASRISRSATGSSSPRRPRPRTRHVCSARSPPARRGDRRDEHHARHVTERRADRRPHGDRRAHARHQQQFLAEASRVRLGGLIGSPPARHAVLTAFS